MTKSSKHHRILKPFLEKENIKEDDEVYISSISEEDSDRQEIDSNMEMSVTPTLITNFKRHDSLFDKLASLRREKVEFDYVFNKRTNAVSHRSKLLT